MTGSKEIKACLFDMDGLLINTEDIYTETTNIILKDYDKDPMTWDLKLQLQGLPGPEASQRVVDHYGLPMTADEYANLNAKIQGDFWPTCSFLPGALELIQYLKSKNIPIALCTSSNKMKYEGKTSHLRDGFSLFDAIITGDDPRIPPGRGKPSPDIWQTGLRELNEKFDSKITADECLVFEDGIIGVNSGKAFGAQVVWVPHPDAIAFIDDIDAILAGQGEMLKSLELLEHAKYCL
ncbi:hypothetical protein Kpol_380p2 [Vanderwaltozyma polyspora DSM 70294]|uniref:Uncharacterized protein n=1 Tax=Vanderwaltozyma polyspora (strain ATCC 22028 / DSM 70294 / BCRC 21397 / CBS 2163 / NBRC 10782 / NRRL Y-8283 / UCD 57-17) TaxID=436907 RepID=A7TS62_VANPO|nr:uncharacterized protein Kpol_380p2 [Vanderwaltozyma polyspora DSM 70294]EDO14884.1 hypothetical protein Kpol_380p2 [Vanderwaltozyma polyspora DSM 70294]